MQRFCLQQVDHFISHGLTEVLKDNRKKGIKFQKCVPYLECYKLFPFVITNKEMYQHYDIRNVFSKSFCTEMKFLFRIIQRRVVPSDTYMCPCLWVPVTTVWRVLRLRIEERPLIWRVAANKFNKHSRTADNGWSPGLGVRRGANSSSPSEILLRNTHGRDASSGDKTIRR